MNQPQICTTEQSPFKLYMDDPSIKVGLFEMIVPSIEEMADNRVVDFNLSMTFLTDEPSHNYHDSCVLRISSSRFDGLKPDEFANECLYEMWEVITLGEPKRGMPLVVEMSGLEVKKIRWTLAESQEQIEKFESEIIVFSMGSFDHSKYELSFIEYGVF